MAKTGNQLRRWRKRILNRLAGQLDNNPRIDLVAVILSFCRRRGIQCRLVDAEDLANDAIRLAMIRAIRQVNQRITGYHPPP